MKTVPSINIPVGFSEYTDDEIMKIERDKLIARKHPEIVKANRKRIDEYLKNRDRKR